MCFFDLHYITIFGTFFTLKILINNSATRTLIMNNNTHRWRDWTAIGRVCEDNCSELDHWGESLADLEIKVVSAFKKTSKRELKKTTLLI